MQVKASAPGKAILFGEHAVVYGKPAIAVAIKKYAHITIKERSDTQINLEIAGMNVHASLYLEDETINCQSDQKETGIIKYVIKALKLIQIESAKGMDIFLEIEMPVGAGLGSSAAVTVATLLVVTCVRVVRTASLQEIQPADVIVIFGAAEYAGHPSPVLRARLDQGLDLFHRGLAPVVITTGGAGADTKFSEGGVGRDYLMRRGVPERSLIAETQGRDTAESAVRVGVIMRANSLHSCVAVSDAYHVFRIRKLLEHEGIGPVYVAPRPDSRPHGAMQRMMAVLREATSYLLWRVGIT